MDNITVTKPSQPPLKEFVESLNRIWESRWLTNRGPFHEEFEAALADYLGVEYVSLFCNGMIALQVGLQALEVMGEVVTTPYSFPATTHAIRWNHCDPVFCDIGKDTCNLDPTKLEAMISSRTSCILPVHVYGTPCNMEGIQNVADRYGLKVFYDAAHAFNVKKNGQSILKQGNLSMLSFHATKVFNTIEGGALVTNDPELKKRIDYLKNFGFENETTVIESGTNGKMNELQAAYGLLQLKYVDGEILKRKMVAESYRTELADVPGIRYLLSCSGVEQNFSYFPIFVNETQYLSGRDTLYEKLRNCGIFGRRYFYPLISELPMYRNLPSADPANLPVATEIAQQIICLPMYAGLSQQDQMRVIEIIKHP